MPKLARPAGPRMSEIVFPKNPVFYQPSQAFAADIESMKLEPPASQRSDTAPERGMKKRIAIAATLAALALASIPLLNSLDKRTEPEENAASGKITGNLPPSIQTEASAAAPDASAAQASLPSLPPGPDTSATPGVAALPKLMVEAVSPAPVTTPAAPVARATGTPALLADKTPAPRALASTAPGTAASVRTAPPALVTPSPTAEPPVTAPVSPARPQGSSFGYSVQLGLFSSVDNAEKLIQALKARGVAAKSETRVQMGPFNTRAEAEEAMAKLRELGYHPLLVPLGQ